MKKIICLMLFAHTAFSQDTLYVNQSSKLYELTPQIQQRVKSSKNGIILVTNESFDSTFFERITTYRKENQLIAFQKGNIRLDTLVVKQLYYMHLHDNPLHYRFIDEMQPYKDLLQCENLLFAQQNYDDENLKNPFFQNFAMKNANDIEGWFQRWRHSPGHNKNMLIDLPDASLRSMLRIHYSNGYITRIIQYIALEIDYNESTRETVQHTRDSANSMIREQMKKFKNRQ